MNYDGLLAEESNKRKVMTRKVENISHVKTQEEENNESIALRRELSNLELVLAQKSSLHNNDVSKLQEQLSKLRSSFEKNELLRQKLDYELTLAQKEISQERRKHATEKYNMQNQIDTLTKDIMKQSSEMEAAESLVMEQKNKLEVVHHNWFEQLSMSEAAHTELKKENEILFEEKLEAEEQVLFWKGKYVELEEKVSLLEGQQQDHVDTIRKLIKDTKYSNEREKELIDNMTELQDKIKTLENNIEAERAAHLETKFNTEVVQLSKSSEAERAAHLETKFNTEVVQLKVRDAENLLSVEGARYNECKSNLDDVNQKCRNLESVLMKEREMYTQMNAAHNKLKVEISKAGSINTKEIAEKTTMISKLTQEITQYQTEMNVLRKEKDATNTKLHNIESNKGDTIKELKFLLNNYKIISEVAKSPDKNDAWNFMGVIEEIRQILEDYQNKLTEKEMQVKTAISNLEKLTAECETHREIEWNRDRALDEAEKLVKIAQNKLLKCQTNCARLEEKIRKLADDEQYLKNLLEERNERITQLNEEMSDTKITTEQNQQSTYTTLQVLFELLTTGSIHPSHSRTDFSLNELKDLIVDRLKDDMHKWKVTSQKLLNVENELECTNKELQKTKEGFKKLQTLNSDVLSKTEKSLIDSRQVWLREKKEIEGLHEKEIFQLNKNLQQLQNKYQNDVVSKTQNIHKKVKETNTYNHKLKKVIHKLEYKSESININTNILTGALWALLLRHRSLCLEKSILSKLLNSLTNLKTNMYDLSKTLLNEMDNSIVNGRSNLEKKSVGILRFRVAAISILALNRFVRIGLFTRAFGRKQLNKNGSLCVFYYINSKLLKSQVRKDEVSNWLYNSSFHNIALRGITKLSMDETNTKDRSPENLVCNYYDNYVDAMREKFSDSSVFTLENENTKNLLIQGLANGLKGILLSRKHQTCFATVEDIISFMRQSVLQFTDRLHQTEVNRRSLKVSYERSLGELDQLKHELKKELEHVKFVEEEDRNMREKLRDNERRIELMISEDHFNEVCTELNHALQREEDLQVLLENQKVEIEKMDSRIEKHEYLNERTDKKLVDKEVKMKQQEEHIEELQKNFIVVKKKKESLQKVAEEKQSEIGRYDREREVMSKYLRNVSTALYESRQQIAFSEGHRSKFDCVLPELITPDELLSVDGIQMTPELKICQNTVMIFVDAQREALQQISNLRTEKQVLQYKITALHNDVTIHKNRIRKLKTQVSAACEEELVEPIDTHTTSPVLLDRPDHFVPLTRHEEDVVFFS